jgi:hypothetical protein
LTFGLGAATGAGEVRVTWPSGTVDVIANVAGNQAITIREGAGLAERTPINRAAAPGGAAVRGVR